MPDSANADFTQKLFCSSDWHIDSKYCDQKMLKRDLQKVKDENAWIVFDGDMFDAMQSKKDPRGRREELRPEFQAASNYSDLLVDYAYEFLKPYQENILLLGKGNHELSFIRHNETDLMSRLVGILNNNKDHKVIMGGYGGWIRFMYQSGTTARGRVTYKYNHGMGGNAPVTKGAIQTNRQAAATTEADITHNGHNHDDYIMPLAKEKLNNKGQLEVINQLYIRTPGYKATFQKDFDGDSWEYTQGTPKPLGSIWVTLGNIEGKPAVTEVAQTF